MTTDYIFFAAAYLDIAKTDADYAGLRRMRDDSASTAPFDCVTIGRKASGEVRLHREPDRDDAAARSDGPVWSLAAGLALALFPSIGADIPASRVLERERLGAVAGVVGRAFGRSDLHEFGALLDASSAGLITATTPADDERVRSALIHADTLMSRLVSIDRDVVERAVGLIAARHRPRLAE